MPDQCAAMLRDIVHALVRQMLDTPVPIRGRAGQCLGGGLELVSAAHLIFVATEASASRRSRSAFRACGLCLLPERVGWRAERLLLFSGAASTAPRKAPDRAPSPCSRRSGGGA